MVEVRVWNRFWVEVEVRVRISVIFEKTFWVEVGVNILGFGLRLVSTLGLGLGLGLVFGSELRLGTIVAFLDHRCIKEEPSLD